MGLSKSGHNLIVAAPLVLFALFLSALAAARRVRRTRLPAKTTIVPPRESTVISREGAVRSVQCAELTMDPTQLQRLWNPTNLENLARTYWRFSTK